MRLRFFTSHCRNNSARDKVIGNKWIYLKRYTFHRHYGVQLKRREQPWETLGCGWSQKARGPENAVVSFYGLGAESAAILGLVDSDQVLSSSMPMSFF